MPLGLERRHNLGHLHFITFSCHNRAGGPYIKSNPYSGCPIHAVSSHDWAFERSSNRFSKTSQAKIPPCPWASNDNTKQANFTSSPSVASGVSPISKTQPLKTPSNRSS